MTRLSMHVRSPGRSTQRGTQRGIALIVVLLILVVVTILGIGAAQIALLGERSTRYDRDYLIASQAAEAALVDAELDIAGPATAAIQRVDDFSRTNLGVFVAGCGTSQKTLGLCAPSAPGAAREIWQTVDFTASPSVAFGTYSGRVFDAGASGIRSYQAPRYIIELVEDRTPGIEITNPPPTMYRITAMGFGPRPDIQVVMQTVYRKFKVIKP